MKLFKLFLDALKWISKIFTYIVNYILFLIVYTTGIGITSLIAKLFGKVFIELKSKKNSYWTDLKSKREKQDNYYQQF